jgi:hypothetical protein
MKKLLTIQDYTEAAATLQCEVASLMAVAKVESAGNGFCPDDFPKILFEGHIFYKYTRGVYSVDHPTISYQSWTTRFYGKTWQAERTRLEEAIKLSRPAALMSTSWGKFQIMGFNYPLCNCVTIQQFVNRMCYSEKEHIALLCEYIIHAGMQDELQAKNWPRFSRLYNGPLYWKNQHDIRLAAAYEKSLLELRA